MPKVLGCSFSRSSSSDHCTPLGSLSDNAFTLNGTSYTVHVVTLDSSSRELRLQLTNAGKPSLKALNFAVSITEPTQGGRDRW